MDAHAKASPPDRLIQCFNVSLSLYPNSTGFIMIYIFIYHLFYMFLGGDQPGTSACYCRGKGNGGRPHFDRQNYFLKIRR